MEFLFNYKILLTLVIYPAMMLKVFLHHFIRYITCAPCSIAYCPKVTAVIPFSKPWIFFLKSAGTPPLQTLHQIADGFGRRVFYMDVNMVFADNTFQNPNIFRITDLSNQIPTTLLNLPFQNMITIFCNPYYMHTEPSHGMTPTPLFTTHPVKLQKCVATESLALKVHSFN